MEIFVNIDVDDIGKAAAFYCHAFDLREERRLFNGSVVEVGGAAAKIYLLPKAAGRDAANGKIHRTYERHWTPVHLDFIVTNVETAVGRAVKAGASLEGDIQTFAWGRLAKLSDPFGHGFCLLQFIDKGYDSVAD